jgi:Protein of unknown function (DUF4031)
MTVLVDSAIWAGRGRLWCHLVSDTSFDELHVFARSLGIPERGFDRDHYDVPAERRPQVVEAGALEVSSKELVRRLTAAGLRRPKHRPGDQRLGRVHDGD